MSSDLEEVFQAATEGRVETLFIKADPWCWEEVAGNDSAIVELGDDPRYAACEQVDMAAVATLKASGRVMRPRSRWFPTARWQPSSATDGAIPAVWPDSALEHAFGGPRLVGAVRILGQRVTGDSVSVRPRPSADIAELAASAFAAERIRGHAVGASAERFGRCRGRTVRAPTPPAPAGTRSGRPCPRGR